MAKRAQSTATGLHHKQSFHRKSLMRARIMKHGTRNFVRNLWLSAAATIVMGVTLLIVFATMVAGIVLNNTVDYVVREKIDFTVNFKSDISEDELQQLAKKMSGVDNVAGVAVSTSKEEYDKLINEKKNDSGFIDIMSDENMINNTMAEMPARMRLTVVNINDLSGIQDMVNNDADFKTWVNDKYPPSWVTSSDVIKTIESWTGMVLIIGLVLGVIFLVISILVVFNTIRMAIFSRRDEIDMMKSIGADKTFVRGPLLFEAEMYGVTAGLIAAILGYVLYGSLEPQLTSWEVQTGAVSTILFSPWGILVALDLVMLGALIGYLSARLAVRRYLKV